jgi:hypothetical protein
VADDTLANALEALQQLQSAEGDTLNTLATSMEALQRLATPLELIPHVADRGVPGQERIYMRANQRVSLRDYLLLVGVRLLDNTSLPSTEHVLWLGNDTLEAGAWLLVYTGPGAPMVTHIRETNEPARVLYWHKPSVIFNDPRTVPILVRFDPTLAQFGEPPQ